MVLAGLGVADRNVTPMVLWDRDGCPQVQIGPRERSGTVFRYRSAGYESLSAHERAAADAEQIRLLYVAATRARDHLAVSLHHRAGQGSHAARLLAPVESVQDLWLRARRRPAGARRPARGRARAGRRRRRRVLGRAAGAR